MNKGVLGMAGIIAALILAGGLVYVSLTTKHLVPPTPPITSQDISEPGSLVHDVQTVPADWQTYEGDGITFQYPPGWNVGKVYYATLAQTGQGIPPSVIAHRIFPGATPTGKDFIDIGGRQIDCIQPHTKCVMVDTLTNFAFTDSTSTEVIEVFDLFVNTIERL